MQKEILRLSALNNVQAITIADLEVQLKIVSANCQESANKMFLAMESKELFLGRQGSGDPVTTRFYLLVRQIKTWSVPFADPEKTGMRIDLSRTTIQEIRRVMPGRSKLDRSLHTPKNVRLFVRGWVGLVM
ncbi:hypothetical protein MMC07_000046 [Pseudocyphellaria aurata]|nr:hypothetical protein [Pseudocyphellaria aurata]